MRKLDYFLLMLVFILGIIPEIFSMYWREKINELLTLKSGFLVIDLVFLVMVLIIAIRFYNKIYKIKNFKNILLPALLLFAWLLLEVIRNLGVYGISAPGEFRFQYLMLVLPFYIGLNFNTIKSRRQIFILLIIFSFYIPLISTLIIGYLKGWVFGEENRFLSSQVHLGMLYGITSILIFNKYKYLKTNYLGLLIFSIPFLFFFIVDSHRSVWMSAITIIFIIVYMGIFKINKVFLFIPFVIIILVIVINLISDTGINLNDYINERTIAFFNPQDDPTSNWRLIMWKSQLGKIISAPLIGEGFGGYWYVLFPDGSTVNISPHNYYIQTTIKIGLIGLVLYLLIIVNIFKTFNKILRSKLKSNIEFPIIIIGLVVLITMHVFYTVYSLEYFSLSYLGIALAVIFDKNTYEFNDSQNLHNNSCP